MRRYVLGFEEIDQTQVALVGGKGANLGELSRIADLRVPAGFCVTTDAFRRILAEAPSVDALLDRMSHLAPDDRDAIATLSAEVRRAVEGIAMPHELAAAITAAIATIGEHGAYAVRSSATAEDLPTASFAGQQDTYLNVVGAGAILQHISHCWASLFTERAVTYRLRNGIEHRKVHMAVVVQQMVFPEVAGILFTADPISGNRKVTSIEASFGLGEALVSGMVNADVYKVRGTSVIEKSVGSKRVAIHASENGGTEERAVSSEQQQEQALSDGQAVALAELGRRIEAHFKRPQDIEWCLVRGEFHVVQSRPITTLFPLPAAPDQENRVYLSVGHQQMMTDAMKPLGLSMWQMRTARPMAEAGGRLFVDFTQGLSAEASRNAFMEMARKSDPLTRDALQSILDRGDFIRLLPNATPPALVTLPLGGAQSTIETDASIPAELIAENQASVAQLKRDIQGKSGPALLDFIAADILEGKRLLFEPRSMQVIMAGMEAVWWLNDKMQEWLWEKNAAGTLTQSIPNNVTSEMGLALLDVADVIRPHKEVVAFLQRVDSDNFLDELLAIAGGRESRDAIQSWLDKYGMRGAGEIDITRPRWSERPSMLVPTILSNVLNFEPGEAARHFEAGLQKSRTKEAELLQRLRALPEGEHKVAETRRMIDRVRTFAGYREYPKYGWVARDLVYKRALMLEADRLVEAGVLREREDIFYLRFDELQEVVRTGNADYALIHQRQDDFRFFQTLSPPRVLTSEGEGVSGTYRRDNLPAGALVGLAVSSGMVEGRARVILDMAKAEVEPGDILVTAFTDPSWTPLFVSIKGLVTEVGGLMTHGAVIAREYGLPAVVGVANATHVIRDGQRIRVHGSEGYVEMLGD